jgi:hypothetical protein
MEVDGAEEIALPISNEEKLETQVSEDQPFPLNEFLTEIGLSTPIDFVFQTFAIQKSRLNVSKMSSEDLLFLFHVMKNEDLKVEIPFPRCAFLEKVLPDDPSLPVKHIIWAIEESSTWKTRVPLSFTEFHLYFNDVLHPNLGYSAEELYKVFDARHDETYFINNGPRKNSIDKKFHVLFVTEKVIVAIQVPEVKYDEIPEKEMIQCKWVSLKENTLVKAVHESAVFLFPKKNLVFTEEEKKEYAENMEEGECKDCAV